MSRALSISSLSLLWLATGCVHSLHPYNSPSQEKFCVQSASPGRFMVRVADQRDYPVATDGRVTLGVGIESLRTIIDGALDSKSSPPRDASFRIDSSGGVTAQL